MAISPPKMIAVASQGILDLSLIEVFLDAKVFKAPHLLRRTVADAVAGWGTRRSGRRAELIATLSNIPSLRLEDGFIRSLRPGRSSESYSLIVDDIGIYYDCTRPSALEIMLRDGTNLLSNEDTFTARNLIVSNNLSKYNHAPLLDLSKLRSADCRRVLVLDQTVGDSSVTMGGANKQTFQEMLSAAYRDNPTATVYVKTHPEVTAGVKRGFLSHVENDHRTVVLHQAINPLSLIKEMDRVYTVTSTMGFEALLAGKNVTCFGVPWYAGWGPTDDRQSCKRRRAKRSVDELFSAAYLNYTIYVNPEPRKLGSIFDLINWIVKEKSIHTDL